MLEKFIVTAKECSENTSFEDKANKILFPLFCEELGYGFEAESIVQKCIFGVNKDSYLDYGIRDFDNKDDDAYVFGIKIVKDGDTFAEHRHLVEECLLINPKIKYGVITDCINYEFYENIVDKNESKGIQLVNEINLCEPNKENEQFIRMVVKKGFHIEDDESISEEYEDESTEVIAEEPPIVIGDNENNKKKKSEFKMPDLSNINIKKVAFCIGGIILAILLIWLLTKVLGKDKNPDNYTPPGTESSEKVDWSQLGQTTTDNTGSTLAYINLEAMLSVKRFTGDSFEISLLKTNIENDAIIKFVLQCGPYTGYTYASIKKGECTASFNIPSEWYDPKVTVIAYLRFDEEGAYAQPQKVIDKYGEKGELIITPKGAPEYAITYTVTSHENEAVVQYINDGIARQQSEQIARRDKDFSQVESLVSIRGDVRIVPHGFSTTEGNLTETRHIYPYIYYNAEKDKVNFYILAGYIGKDWYNFDAVNIFADTYKWGYKVSTNPKKTDLGGNALSEYVQFSDDSVLTLLNDMNLLAASNETTIRFSGAIRKDYEITDEEKENIKYFLYLYETYFDNGKTSPDLEWFQIKGDAIDLDYLKTPTEVRMRNSEQILDMENKQKIVSNKRASGITVTPEEQLQLEQMGKTFKAVDDSLFTQLFAAIKNGEAFAIYDMDDEHGANPYMKFYLYYDDPNGTIESGYIPYIIVYSNKTVHIPIVTVDKNTSDITKTLASVEIDPVLYSNIVSEMKKVNYTYFGSVETKPKEDNPVESEQPIESNEPMPEITSNPYEGFVFFGDD